MIRIYAAAQLGDGSEETPYCSLLDGLIDTDAGDRYGEIDNPARHYSICDVHASKATHNKIMADGRAVPLSPLCEDAAALKTFLDAPFSSWPAAQRTTAQQMLESRGVDTSWVTAKNMARDVIRYIIRHHAVAQIADGERSAVTKALLAADPATTFGSLSLAQKTTFLAWCAAKGIATTALTDATTARVIVRTLAQTANLRAMLFAGESL